MQNEDISFDLDMDDLFNIVFIVGYSCKSISKRIYCKNCNDFISTSQVLTIDNQCESLYVLIEMCNRGRLTYPTQISIIAGIVCLAVFQHLISKEIEKEFINCTNHFKVFCDITEKFVFNENFVKKTEFKCDCGNSKQKLLKQIIKTCANVFLKKLCLFKIRWKKKSNKIKLNTLTQ